MKCKFAILFIFVLNVSIYKGHAQSYSNGFSVSLGAVQDGVGGLISYNYFIDRHDFIEAGLFLTAANYKYKEDIKIPYNDFTANIGFSKNVFYNYQNTFNVNLCGGGVFGYETLNRGDKNLSNGALILSKQSFIFGGYLGVDIDYSITDKTSLLLKANQFYHANSSLGEFMPYVGVGVRFYPN